MKKVFIPTLVLLFLALADNSVFVASATDLPGKVTFAEHIAPLVFNHCTTCHRPGQVAPFSLLSYADARKHGKMMLRVVNDRQMPPWQPEPGHGEFRDSRRLSDAQMALFAKWVEGGFEEGDAKKTPAVPDFAEDWQLGKPDLVVKMDKAYSVPADGADIYQNFVIPMNLTEDKWVTAVEFRASAPKVIHHVLYFLDDTGRAKKLATNNKNGQPGFPGMGFRPTGAMGGWAVGAAPVRLPQGLAYSVKKGSDLVLQTHLHLSGKAESELITVGLYFSDTKPTRKMARLQLPPSFGLFSNIDIPAGKADFTISESFVLPVDVDLIAASGHAHYIAKSMRTWATLPDKTEQKLFYIKDWDFNWQGQYLYKDFVRLPKGTVIHGQINWDNSAANSRNQHQPPMRVQWGEGSTDEMGMVGLIMVAAKESEYALLQTALRDYLVQSVIRSRLRGDKIDWQRLGIPEPALWNSPAKLQ